MLVGEENHDVDCYDLYYALRQPFPVAGLMLLNSTLHRVGDKMLSVDSLSFFAFTDVVECRGITGTNIVLRCRFLMGAACMLCKLCVPLAFLEVNI